MTVGVCDWGVGGLGFYRLLREARPDLDVVYLGDQGALGYGKLPRPVLAARVRAVLETFRDLGVSEVVVACNAASTVLGEAKVEGVGRTGMIRPTLDALSLPLGGGQGGDGFALSSVSVRDTGPHPCPSPATSHAGEGFRIGIIGGRRTVLSGAYARPLRAAGWTVRNRIAQPLSGLIEAGDLAGAELALGPILRPLRGVDRLVLACTHYVVLADAIRARLPGTDLIDPAALAWARLAPNLPPKTDRAGTTRFVTTGDPAEMARTALAAFRVECRPESIVVRQ